MFYTISELHPLSLLTTVRFFNDKLFIRLRVRIQFNDF